MKILAIPNSIDKFLKLIHGSKSKSKVPADVVIAAADHGVARENISRYQYGDTIKIFKIVASSHSPIVILSKSLGIQPSFINVGCLTNTQSPKICSRYWAGSGSKNIIQEDAMTVELVETIFDKASQFSQSLRADHLCLGEVGIGNTLCSTLIVALLTNQCPTNIMGLGSGINTKSYLKKNEVGLKVLSRFHKKYPNSNYNPLQLLASLGGIDLVWNTGMILSAAQNNKMVYLDGLNTTVSAYIACLIEPSIKENLIATHLSREPAHKAILELGNLKPFLDLDLALGQGFGALLGFSFLNKHSHLF